MSGNNELLVLIGTLSGSLITGLFSFLIAILDKKQRKSELYEQISLEKKKFFSEKQREKSLELCEQLELFRNLEEKYIEEISSLRKKYDIEPNKNQSIKIEFREKVNTDDNRITYSKSDYLNYKKYFTEIAFVSE